MTYFAATYAYGVPESELAPVRDEHRTYLASLPELFVSGPWDDGRGALLIFQAETGAQVEALLDADPFVSAGFVAERAVRPWKPFPWKPGLDALAQKF